MAISVQQYVVWFNISVYNAALVQEVPCQNNFCGVESSHVFMKSLKPGNHGKKSASFAIFHDVTEGILFLEI
jgi:hypothetical protein